MGRLTLRDASREEIHRILESTHAIWSDGLLLDAYREYVDTLMSSEWARAGNYRFLVLVDGEDPGTLLTSMKLYRFLLRIGRGSSRTSVTAGGVGAIFTPEDRRGRGHARRMVELAHEAMTERGDGISLLHSEIGADYYAAMGYRLLSPRAARLVVPSSGPLPGGLKRMHRTDIESVMTIRERGDAANAMTVERDRDLWAWLLARASYPTLHLGRERWESRIMMKGGEGYLWSLQGEGDDGPWSRLLEVAEVEPGAAMPALLDDLFDECRRRGISQVEAGLPHDAIARDRRVGGIIADLTPSCRTAGVAPMWLPLRPTAEARVAEVAAGAALHLADVF